MSQTVTHELASSRERRFAKAVYQSPDLVADRSPATQEGMKNRAMWYIPMNLFDLYMCACRTLDRGCDICLGTHVVPIPIQEMKGVMP